MKIRMGCGIGYVGAEHYDEVEIPDEELEGMTEDEKEDYIYETYLIPFGDEYFEVWYEKIEDNENEGDL